MFIYSGFYESHSQLSYICGLFTSMALREGLQRKPLKLRHRELILTLKSIAILMLQRKA